MKKDENQEWIHIKKASTHNLKNIDVSIPHKKITVITGLSGSGKSSLAFDTIFAEGQRRYVESLSAYARQFLNQLSKPEVEDITGLAPAISIDQKSRSNNPRSTVATITEIYDYLRVLFARIGKVKCMECGRDIHRHSKEDIVKIFKKDVRKDWGGKNVASKKISKGCVKILAPVVVGRKGEWYQLLYDFLALGFESAIVDGVEKKLRNKIELSKNKKHTIEIVVDEIDIEELKTFDKDTENRVSESIETAITETRGLVKFIYPDKTEKSISANFLCPYDGFSFPEIEPRLFSFNSPYGACTECNGLGVEDLWLKEVCKVCNGSRLRGEALNVFIGGKNIIEIISLTASECYEYFGGLKLNEKEKEIALPLVNEIESRIGFLIDVGLDYMQINRKANTLSGGEAQRIRLASQLGSRLVGTLYVLDEPTIGLHQRDNDRLIKTLKKLKDLGNTIIVVEHDEDTIFSADYLIDIGPNAGIHGGEVIEADWIDKLLDAKKSKSLTLKYLKGEEEIVVPKNRRTENRGKLSIKKASVNNIKNLNVDIPLGKLVTISGVSGSGKSSLLYDIVYKNLKAKVEKKYKTSTNYDIDEISGTEYLSRLVLVNQSPIGRTPRSTPITYTGAYNFIRDIYAFTEESRIKGWTKSRFSFNVKGGRCEHCQGNGNIAVEMHFLPTVYVKCDSCFGRRFTKETLAVLYKGKNIYDVLEMSVEEGLEFFKDIPAIKDRLNALNEVGLGYIRLGQPSTELSGGEAQRVKIASELYLPHTRKTMYLLDEPTVGLHYEDVRKLIEILNKLVDKGNTVVVIEHNMDILKTSDYIIDMGPEGGVAGGKVVAKGTPETIANSKTHTGVWLKKSLKKKK